MYAASTGVKMCPLLLYIQEKHSRLKRLKRLSELEVAMCRCLNESPQLLAVIQSGQIPSDEELQNYRGLVGRLEQKKVCLCTCWFVLMSDITVVFRHAVHVHVYTLASVHVLCSCHLLFTL